MSVPFYISYAALWVLVIVQGMILLGLVHIVHQLQQTDAAGGNTGMKSGRDAPAFNAVTLTGVPISSASFAGRMTALLFVSATCPSCMTTLAELEALSYKARDNIIVICRGEHEDCVQLAKTYKLNLPVVADENNQIGQLYEISSVPTAVLINANKRIQSVGAPLREELQEMVEKAPDIQEVNLHGAENYSRN